jgi:coproporphyrinogen dehydrogenase HemZ
VLFRSGTPTSLNSLQLKGLLDFIESKFEMRWLEEYTLEAGRPDSINEDKLGVIKESRVDRISINPQSMNDETLRLIGRNHTSEDVIKAFRLAKSLGFNNINMDVIIGLPGESKEMFCNTLKRIKELDPENLTVHTMAIKRASKLNEDKEKYKLISSADASEMVETAAAFADSIGMHPYYLYRQKNVLGNLENVGYCKPGTESVYNIQIMEEKQTIIALGAGAVTKVVYPKENRIERAFNVKDVEEYILRVKEMVERKRGLL